MRGGIDSQIKIYGVAKQRIRGDIIHTRFYTDIVSKFIVMDVIAGEINSTAVINK